MKPVLAVPLWLALPLYAMYAAVWIAAIALVVAIGAVTLIGHGLVALSRRRRTAPSEFQSLKPPLRMRRVDRG